MLSLRRVNNEIVSKQAKNHNMKFSEEQIETSKLVEKVVLEENIKELNAVFMAGKVCMWVELQKEKAIKTHSK